MSKYVFFFLVFLYSCSNQEDYKSLYNQAIVETDNENYTEAIDLLNQSINLNSEFDSAYAERAYCHYVVAEELNLALEDIEKAVKINFKNFQFKYLRGLINYQMLNDNEALKDFEYIINRKDSLYHELALESRVEIYFVQEDYSKAHTDCIELIELDSLSSGYYCMLGTIMSKNNLYNVIKDTLPSLDTSENVFNEYFTYYNYSDETYSMVSQHVIIDSTGSLKSFEKAIELDKRNSWAFYQKALTLNGFNQNSRALIAINNAILLEEISKYYELRALLFKSEDNSKQALKDFDRAIELDSNNETAILNKESLIKEMNN